MADMHSDDMTVKNALTESGAQGGGKKERFVTKDVVMCVAVLAVIALVAGVLLGLVNWLTYVDPDAAVMERVAEKYGIAAEQVTAEDGRVLNNPGSNSSVSSVFAAADGFRSANFNFSIGNDVYNANAIEWTTTGRYSYRNLLNDMAYGNRWTNIDANGNFLNWNNADELAALNANTTTFSPYTERYVLTDHFVEDASFLRLNTLTLGYTLPKSVLSKIHLSNVRFYVTGYNLFCITSYSGFDPEVSTMRRTNLTPGVDYSAYPKSRQFVVGVNLNF